MTATFTSSPTGPTDMQVRLVQSASTPPTGNFITIDVVLNSTSGINGLDVFAFAFDILIGNSAVASFVSSAPGNVLTPAAGQTVISDAAPSGANRVAVGVTLAPPPGDSAIPAGDVVVISLTFQLLQVGDSPLTITGSPNNMQNPTPNPTAFDSVLMTIPAITFDAAAATLSGS
ncbi:MAG: hypothetical protein ACE5HD_06795 [Acidobacteriota bacterium]